MNKPSLPQIPDSIEATIEKFWFVCKANNWSSNQIKDLLAPSMDLDREYNQARKTIAELHSHCAIADGYCNLPTGEQSDD